MSLYLGILGSTLDYHYSFLPASNAELYSMALTLLAIAG